MLCIQMISMGNVRLVEAIYDSFSNQSWRWIHRQRSPVAAQLNLNVAAAAVCCGLRCGCWLLRGSKSKVKRGGKRGR